MNGTSRVFPVKRARVRQELINGKTTKKRKIKKALYERWVENVWHIIRLLSIWSI